MTGFSPENCTAMSDPYAILGLPDGEDLADERVRARYLELIKEFPPEQHPARFAAIRSAYEKVRDLPARAQHRLFDRGADDTLEAIIEIAERGAARPRPTLAQMIEATEAPPPP